MKPYHVTYVLLQYGSIALHKAVMMGNTELVATLIKSGADVNAFDKVS